jgi:hypothetical protein
MILIGAAALCPLLSSQLVFADDAKPVLNEKFADLEPGIKMLREDVGQDRRDLVKANMLLTASEGTIFWPLYDEYRAEQHKLTDKKLKLISDYAAHRDTMTEDQAEKLTEEALKIEKEKIEIKEDYVKKMSKVLSARTVARFFHIETKLDAIVDVWLASKVPLIK